MKNTIYTFTLLLITFVVEAQSRKDLLEQIENYQRKIVFNQPFDVEKSKLFEAMNVVGSTEYQRVVRESESRGFCEYYYEDEFTQETLIMEIMNETKPFRVTFNIERKKRTKDYISGVYTQWVTSYSISQKYLLKLQLLIYKTLFGPVPLSDDLIAAIDKFNGQQTKEKKKILKDRDY